MKLSKDTDEWAEDNYRTVKMAVDDLPWPTGRYISHRANSQMRGPRNRDISKQPAFTLRVRGDEFAFCSEPATGAFSPGACPDMDMFYYECENNLQKTLRENPPKWIKNYKSPITVDHKKNLYLKGTRRLAVREQARLQTFPDWFSFYGRPVSQSRQIGNAVPPLFARVLFTEIIKQSENRNE